MTYLFKNIFDDFQYFDKQLKIIIITYNTNNINTKTILCKKRYSNIYLVWNILNI